MSLPRHLVLYHINNLYLHSAGEKVQKKKKQGEKNPSICTISVPFKKQNATAR